MIAAFRLISVAAAGLAALGGTAFAAEREADAGAGSAPCAAVRVAEAIASGPGPGCVVIEGWAMGDMLMDAARDRYARQRIYNDPSSSGRQLGLANWQDEDGGIGAAHVRLTGTLRRCENASFGNLLPHPAGAEFCENMTGLYLDVDRAQLMGRAPLVRAVAGDGADLGNLTPIADGPVRRAMLAAFQPILDRHRADGGAALRQMLPQAQRRDFAAQGALASDAAIEVLGWREPAWADEAARAAWAQQAARHAEAIVCAMDAGRAARNLWPISTQDIGLAAGRPYFCVRLSQRADDRVQAEQTVDENPAGEG